jgi:hypothetical protein
MAINNENQVLIAATNKEDCGLKVKPANASTDTKFAITGKLVPHHATKNEEIMQPAAVANHAGCEETVRLLINSSNTNNMLNTKKFTPKLCS